MLLYVELAILEYLKLVDINHGKTLLLLGEFEILICFNVASLHVLKEKAMCDYSSALEKQTLGFATP